MKKIRIQRGITLIALIITIIILLILSVVTIGSIKNSNIISYAENASTNYESSKSEEQDILTYYESIINSSQGKVTNPYNPDKWDFGFALTDEGWGNKVEKGNKLEGRIVAKFYKTGNKITINTVVDTENVSEEIDETILVIEGAGSLGELNSTVLKSETNIMLGIKELIVTDGITYIPNGTFKDCENLTNAKITNTVESIETTTFLNCKNLKSIKLPERVRFLGAYSFKNCINLQEINIPNDIETIGSALFSGCISLKHIEIPAGINHIAGEAFKGCEQLTKVKILTTSDTIDIAASAFSNINKNATIYVLNNNIKAAVEAVAPEIDVQIVSEEQMSNI